MVHVRQYSRNDCRTQSEQAPLITSESEAHLINRKEENMLTRKGSSPTRHAIAEGAFSIVRWIFAACLLSCLCVVDALAYTGPEMTLRFATIKNRQLSQGQQWNHFAELVNQATGGKVKVQVFYDGTLFGERTAVEAVLN